MGWSDTKTSTLYERGCKNSEMLLSKRISWSDDCSFCDHSAKIEDKRDHSYKTTLRDQVGQGVQLVLVVIAGSKSTYDVVKKYCCLEYPSKQRQLSLPRLSFVADPDLSRREEKKGFWVFRATLNFYLFPIAPMEWESSSRNSQKPLSLISVLLPSTTKGGGDDFTAHKWLCFTFTKTKKKWRKVLTSFFLSVVSQCIKANTLKKKNLKSVATKVILQMQVIFCFHFALN